MVIQIEFPRFASRSRQFLITFPNDFKKVNSENLVASDDPIHGFQNSAPDYADDYPMLGEINNVFSESLAAVHVHDRPSRRTGITVKIVIYHFWGNTLDGFS